MTTLAEVERELALFSQGICARYPQFSNARTDVLNFGFEHVYELTLPNEINFYEDQVSNQDVFRWMAIQQMAFHRFGTLQFDIDLARSRIRFLQSTEGSSSPRTPALELFYQHFHFPDLARELFYVIEAARVRELMLVDFPGATRLFRLFLSTQEEHSNSGSQQGGSLPDLIERELNSPRQMSPATQSLLGTLFQPNSTVYDSAQATVWIYSLFIDDSAFVSIEELKGDGESVDLSNLQRRARLEDWRENLKEMEASLSAMSFAEEMGDEKRGSEGMLSEASIREMNISVEERERDQLKRLVDMESSLLSQYSRTSLATQPHFRYDEWDYLSQQWLRNWCKVFEIRDIESEAESSALIDQVRPLVSEVRKQFEQVKPAGMRRVSHVIDGDEIDIDSLIEVRMDIRAKSSPDERVYSEMARLQRDVSACLLVDLSASTDDPVEPEVVEPLNEDQDDPFDDPYLHGVNFDPDQEEREPPRKIVDIQKESVLLLATALEDIGDLYSVYGFSGYSRDCVEIHVAKDFDETLSLSAIQSIASMKPLRSTRMGPAIRHATHRLRSIGTALSVLIVISDGFPQDCDYGPDRSDHEYGIQDTAKAIREALDKGVQVFCITVDVSGHDYLKRMCPDDRYLVIEETNELPNALHQVYRQLTS